MESLAARKQALSEQLSGIKGKDEKLKFIIDSGKSLPPMPEKFKIDQFLVKGCLSKAWLFPQFSDGRVSFQADSEAFIVKGIIALLLKVYNDSTAAEIKGETGEFLEELGVTQHLSSNRRNGLSQVLRLIQHYAQAFAANDRATE